MTLDTILWVTGSLAQAAVLVLLIYRRFWRVFPVFFVYSIWSLAGNSVNAIIFRLYSPASSTYAIAYLANLLIDSLLIFSVLVELAWSVIRPLRGKPPRSTIIVVALLILVAGAAIWPFTTFPDIQHVQAVNWEVAAMIRLKQAVAAVAVLIFLILAAGSQVLAIGWRNRELQIATGLGLYSMVDIVVTVLHTYPSMRSQYNLLEEFLLATYLLSLVYWTVSFAQAEEKRREMSPQMQDMLLAVAGVAKSTRVSLANSRVQSPEDREER